MTPRSWRSTRSWTLLITAAVAALALLVPATASANLADLKAPATYTGTAFIANGGTAPHTAAAWKWSAAGWERQDLRIGDLVHVAPFPNSPEFMWAYSYKYGAWYATYTKYVYRWTCQRSQFGWNVRTTTYGRWGNSETAPIRRVVQAGSTVYSACSNMQPDAYFHSPFAHRWVYVTDANGLWMYVDRAALG